MEDLKEKLKLAECPSNWGLADLKDRKSATFIIDKLLEKEEEISEPWVHVCINLTIAYLHSENGDISKAITVLKECEGIMNSSNNNLIVQYKPALLSVYNASRASILILSSTPSEVKMFSDKIVQLEDLDIPNQAAIYAIKANVFLEFGVTGSTIAVEYAREALKKNGKEADWHFLMGKLLSRLRHFTQDHEITSAEISHLQTAYNLAGTPRSAIFLANAYIEKSKSLNSGLYKTGIRPDYSVRNTIKELSTEAKRLIKIALEKNDNQCVHILIRCAYAYSKLPRYDRECDLANQLLEESLKRSPCNPMANKLAGDLSLQGDKPLYHKALKHFKIAASRNVFSANFAAFDIEVKLSLNPDVEKFYAGMLKQFTENNYQMLTFIHATEYYLFIRRDLCTAVNYFMKAIELDPNFHALTDRWVKYIQKNVNFFELISNEVRHSIDSQMFHDIHQMNLLKNALKKFSEINPKLMGVPVVPNKVQSYLDTYEKESKNVSGRGRGRGRGRGNGRGGGRGRGRGGETGAGMGRGGETGRINNGERRGFGPRNRSSSRNRVGQNMNERNENYHSNFDQSQFDRLSYAHDKSEEVLENPYYVKFLELKYKKMTKSASFKEWLQEYEKAPPVKVGTSNKTPTKEKGDGDSGAKSQEPQNSDAKFNELIAVINQLKEEINEIKLSETRSCCSSGHYRNARCHSLKSLEYNELRKSRRPEEYYCDKNEIYRRKHSAHYPSHDRYMDPREKYHRRHGFEDRYRWRSEDRNAKYNRILPSHMEKDRYNIRSGYYESPEREIRRRSQDDSDSNSDSGSRYHSSRDHRIERRSRRSSFSDKRIERKSSRHSSPTYSRRMGHNSSRNNSPTSSRRLERQSSRHSSPTYSDTKHRTSSRRRLSEDRRLLHEHFQNLDLGDSNSNSSATDSQSYPSPRGENQRRRGSVDSEYLRYRKNSFSETERGVKHSKQGKSENQQSSRRLNEEKLKKGIKSIKKEVSSSSSASSTDEDGENRKVNDQDSDREPCLGYGKVKHPNIRKEDSSHRSYKEHHDCSSESDEKSVSKKSFLKSKEKVKGDLGYERSFEECSERGYKNKNREVYSEPRNDKYSSSGAHKLQNLGSKGNKGYDERSEVVNKMDTKRNKPKPSSGEQMFFTRECPEGKNRDPDFSRDEALKNVRKSHDFDKPESHSRKSSSLKDSSYSQFDTKREFSRKGPSNSRSSSEWENIGHQEATLGRSEANRSDRESRCSRYSGDEYEKTSSG